MNSMLVLNIIDDIGESVIEQFTKTISTSDLLLSLLVAVLAALIINVTYRKTYVGVSYTKSFSLSIILLTLVTSIVIRTISSNLSLSLGMVGALSIVRFRTAVKDPVDTIFMFWSITAGIMSGAGFYIVTVLSTLIIAVIYFVSYVFQIKKTNKLLLVVVCNIEKSKEIVRLLNKNKKCALKTEMYKDDMAELTYEVAHRKEIESVLNMSGSDGVQSINVIDIDWFRTNDNKFMDIRNISYIFFFFFIFGNVSIRR